VGTGFENPDEICASLPVGVRLLAGGVGAGGGADGEAEGRGATTDGSIAPDDGTLASAVTGRDEDGVAGRPRAGVGACSPGCAGTGAGVAGTSTISRAGQPTSLNRGRSEAESLSLRDSASRSGVCAGSDSATG